MNFFNNIPNFQPQNEHLMLNDPALINNNINNKINELELKIKKLEQRIYLLETNHSVNNYQESDNSLYMI